MQDILCEIYENKIRNNSVSDKESNTLKLKEPGIDLVQLYVQNDKYSPMERVLTGEVKQDKITNGVQTIQAVSQDNTNRNITIEKEISSGVARVKIQNSVDNKLLDTDTYTIQPSDQIIKKQTIIDNDGKTKSIQVLDLMRNTLNNTM